MSLGQRHVRFCNIRSVCIDIARQALQIQQAHDLPEKRAPAHTQYLLRALVRNSRSPVAVPPAFLTLETYYFKMQAGKCRLLPQERQR